jgi:hypothetical protein
VAPGLLTSVLPPGMIVLVGSTPVIAVASTMTALSAVLPGLPGFSTMTALFALLPRGIRCAHGAAVELVRRRRGAGSARWRGYPRRGYEEHSPITANKAALLIWQPPSLALSWPPYYQGEMNPP